MDKISTKPSDREERTTVRYTDLYLHAVLVLALLCSRAVGWIDWSTFRSTLIGMMIAAVGGIVIGLVAYRYLGNYRNNREVLVGMVLTVGFGVLTIGYLYIIHIKGPMSSIGTINRAVKQVIIFTEFLFAHISGIKLGKRFLS